LSRGEGGEGERKAGGQGGKGRNFPKSPCPILHAPCERAQWRQLPLVPETLREERRAPPFSDAETLLYETLLDVRTGSTSECGTVKATAPMFHRTKLAVCQGNACRVYGKKIKFFPPCNPSASPASPATQAPPLPPLLAFTRQNWVGRVTSAPQCPMPTHEARNRKSNIDIIPNHATSMPVARKWLQNLKFKIDG
jgi:hypothetical protein